MSQALETSSCFETVQETLGATFGDYRGHRIVGHFEPTSERDEYAALTEGCAIVDRSFVSGLEMTGEDRQRFLNGLVTCDTKELPPGAGCFGFVTDVKGRILDSIQVLALEDRLWLELSPGRGEAIREHLSKYIIIDRVEITPLPWVPLTLIGPESADFLSTLGCDVGGLDVYGHREGRLLDQSLRVVRERDLGETVQWSLWLPRDRGAELYQEIIERGKAGAAARPVGFEAYERLRVESAWPLYGVDFDGENFPQETGLDDAVSYTKGCYLGQEIVARIHYRGGVNKRLRWIRPETFDPQAVGRLMTADGRAAGTLTSCVESHEGPLGLAILHKRVDDGTTVEIEGFGKAEVAALP